MHDLCHFNCHGCFLESYRIWFSFFSYQIHNITISEDPVNFAHLFPRESHKLLLKKKSHHGVMSRVGVFVTTQIRVFVRDHELKWERLP